MGTSVMVVTRNDLFQIPYLNALTSSLWDNQSMKLGLRAGVYRLPSCVELQDDATIIADLVGFSLDPEGFRLLAEWKRLFKLVRCADFLGVDCFLQFVAETLHVEVNAINNAIAIHRVRHLLRSKYRSASHHAKKHAGKTCRLCYTSLGKQAPHYSNVVVMPCCRNKVHAECLRGEDSCKLCLTSFNILKCAECRADIEDWEEAGPLDRYREAILHRLPCCRPDMHALCMAVVINRPWPHCPCCSVPLTSAGSMDRLEMTAGDVLAGRRHLRLNEVKRRGEYTPIPWRLCT